MTTIDYPRLPARRPAGLALTLLVHVAPLDSSQIRMRNKMQAAHDAVPPRAWEAPAVEELGNASGAPVTRVRGALGTYCLTARSPGAGIDAFERKGGIRRTACPNESSQGGSQGWRTARD